MTPLDLSPLPSNEQTNLDSAARVKFVRDLHEKVRLEIIKKNKHFARLANKGKKQLTFEPGDWVGVHMRKERFPMQKKLKLHPRGIGHFQVVERINDNAYKLDLPGEYGVSASFNVSDLSPFEFLDSLNSRTSPFEERWTDMNIQTDASKRLQADNIRVVDPASRSRLEHKDPLK